MVQLFLFHFEQFLILEVIYFIMIADKKEDNHNTLKGYNMLLYFAGSMVMYEPSEECVVDFWKKGILTQLPVKSMNPRFLKAASQLRDSCKDKKLCAGILADDYNRLFPSEGFPLAPLYESVYKDDRITETGKINNSVSEFYDSYGWISKFRGKKADDHLGIEILFLTRLIEKYLVIDDNVCQIEMRNEILRFIDQHIMTWIPKWNEQMQEHATTLCYKGIGTLIYACIEDISSVLSHSD